MAALILQALDVEAAAASTLPLDELQAEDDVLVAAPWYVCL